MKLIFILFFITTFYLSYSQNSFTISGVSKSVTSGQAIIGHTLGNEFYSIKVRSDTAIIKEHRFKFVGKVQSPQKVRLILVDTATQYITEPFFIDTGLQQLVIDSNRSNDDIKEGLAVTVNGSAINLEFKENYLRQFDSVNRRLGHFFSQLDICYSTADSVAKHKCIVQSEFERLAIRKIRDSILLSYATRFPTSQIPRWQLAEAVKEYGYNQYYQTTFDKIRDYVPKDIGSSLNTYLVKQKSKSVGSVFPLRNYINQKISDNFLKHNKYTLVEYWFSGCGPCLRQFKALRTIYNRQKKKGFNIVAISVDTKEAIPAYNKLLKQNKYPWKQILDVGGRRSRLLEVYKFPTTFLLDSAGRIISVNVNPDALQDFLEKELSTQDEIRERLKS